MAWYNKGMNKFEVPTNFEQMPAPSPEWQPELPVGQEASSAPEHSPQLPVITPLPTLPADTPSVKPVVDQEALGGKQLKHQCVSRLKKAEHIADNPHQQRQEINQLRQYYLENCD